MKMKKLTAMSMAVMMAATMSPAGPAMAADGGKVYSNQKQTKHGRILQKPTQKKQEQKLQL